MLRIKHSFLLSFFAGIMVVSCAPKDKSDRVLSFDRNLVNTKDPELVCQLSEDSVLLKDIVNFTVLNDTSFVVTDGQGVYLYHISGVFKKQLGKKGQAGGEMISPSHIYATSDFVYIWCSSLMKFLIFDHEANFIKELSGFKRAVKKFIVNPSNEILYIYTSGFFDDVENKTNDVIDIYNIADESSKKYGERGPEDEVLSTWRNSGGLYIDADRLIYIHPGNLTIYDLDLNSDKTIRYNIDDIAFNTTKMTSHVREVMQNLSKLTDYLGKNSFVKDLYKDNDQFIIVSEIGQNDFDERGQISNTKKRKIKLYILDSFFNANCTILYDYIGSPNFVIYSNALYFTTVDIDNDDQIITLNRFSLPEK